MNNRIILKAILTILTLVLSHNICEAQTKRTIHVATAGTLPELISEEEKYQIEELTLTGYLNGTDFKYIQEMAGDTIVKSYARTSNYTSTDKGMSSSEVINHSYTERPWKVVDHMTTTGKLKKLDLSKADIVGTVIIRYDPDDKGYWDYYYGPNNIPTGLFNNTHLEEIVIPNSVISIDPDAFRMSTLSSIKVGDENAVYDSRNDCNGIIESSSNKLIFGFEKTIIPNSVTSIGGSAFSGCSGLTSINIPNSVTSIGDYAFSGCSGLTSMTIPNSVTSIGGSAFSGCSSLTSIAIPNSVTSIGEQAFYDCSGLTSINIPNSVTSLGSKAFDGTAWYNNQPDGLVYAGLFAYVYKGEMPVNTTIILKEGTTGIASGAFCYCKNLSAVTIPSSIKRINRDAFRECTGLTSATLPANLESIGACAFFDCTGLTSITLPKSLNSIEYGAFLYCTNLVSISSKIEKPFEIDESVFDSGDLFSRDNYIYLNTQLSVPVGTKSLYQNTKGWDLFVNIVEEDVTDEIEFSIDGVTYLGSSSDKTVQVKSVDTSLPTVEIPASVSYEGAHYQVSGIDEHAFDGSTMAALVWNVDVSLPSNAFKNASIGSNFLLYVKSESYAPSSVKNVVVNGTAQSIVLSDDGGLFCCPQSFMAEKISYTHNYSMETGGDGKGWETIALPFNVQKISHSTRGEIVPFASYNGGSNQKPFWLASMSSSGFSRSSSIQANQPYIIAMPNSNKYQNDYNLAGDVTFSAENVSVPATPTFSGTFLPAYSTVAKSASVYALNVKNRYVSYSGNYDAGSRFISSLRDVRPFEAYISESSTRGIIEIGSGDGTTGMPDVIGVYDADRLIDIYTLSGQKVAQSKQSEIDNILNQLPHGVYIVNGKKIVK